MSKIFSNCPSCGKDDLSVTNIECNNCHTKFSGNFEVPWFSKLSAEELSFVINFVKCSGSLKEMAKIHNVSYPTLRNKLNDLIERINQIDNPINSSKNDILQLLENGKISAKEAAKMLYEV